MSQGIKTRDKNSRLVALGLQLKEAREAHAYSIAEVAERLFISSNQVNAIEDAQYQHLPAEVFVKGYLRSYAKLLDIDPEKIVNQYQPPPVAAPTAKPVFESDQPKPKPLRERLPDTSTTLVYGALAALVLLFVVSVFYFSTAGDSLPEEAPAEPTDAPAVEQSSRASDSSPGLYTPGGHDSGTPVESDATFAAASLEMQFSDDCWVEVRDASRKLLLADMRRAGDTEIVEGEPPYRVVLGTSQAVALRFQGRYVPVVPEPGKRSAQLVIGG